MAPKGSKDHKASKVNREHPVPMALMAHQVLREPRVLPDRLAPLDRLDRLVRATRGPMSGPTRNQSPSPTDGRSPR